MYPPLKKAFAVLEYMADHFIDQFHWFIRGDDDMYARGKALQSLLMKFDSEQVCLEPCMQVDVRISGPIITV